MVQVRKNCVLVFFRLFRDIAYIFPAYNNKENIMRIYAVNGSPRKKWNTATVLQRALDGAAQAGGAHCHVEMLHLYDYRYKGCLSCFECKRTGGPSYGKCAVRDELAPVLEKLAGADGVIFGSPVYFHSVTGMMRSFLERLMFPLLVYDRQYSSLAPQKTATAFIYTMNVTREVMLEQGYPEKLRTTEAFMERIFSRPAVLHVHDTYQFSDYSKYKVECFSEEEKARHRKEQFPLDCQKAYELGAALARQAERAGNILRE